MEQTAVGYKVQAKVDLDHLDSRDPEALRVVGLLEKVMYEKGLEQRARLRGGVPADVVRSAITVEAGILDATYGLHRRQTDHLEGICLLAAGLTQ